MLVWATDTVQTITVRVRPRYRLHIHKSRTTHLSAGRKTDSNTVQSLPFVFSSAQRVGTEAVHASNHKTRKESRKAVEGDASMWTGAKA